MTKDAKKDPAKELEILFPDVDVTVTDPDTGHPVDLTIREPRYLDGLRIGARHRALITALAALMEDGQVPDPTAIDGLIVEHEDDWLALMSTACGMEPGWIARLGDEDGEELALAVWSTHGPLLVRRAVRARMVAARLSARRASSQSSSGPDTPADTQSSPAG